MKILLQLYISPIRPENMRVVFDDESGFYLVQTQSICGKWITQKEHKNEKTALLDCVDWY